METTIHVFADWILPNGDGLPAPQQVGTLTSSTIRNKEAFNFEYTPEWLASSYALPIDPELHLFSGRQYSDGQNFRIFLDSCPDRWGRLLMKRREAAIARQEERRANVLMESDYLLGVHDQYRMGDLRFKRNIDGAFLDDNTRLAAPHISFLRELEHAVSKIEEDNPSDDPDYLKWLFMLISPGSPLGGARPKACVVDTDDSLWIEKFPSRYDDYDIGAWEFVVHQLAVDAGIAMAECRVQRFNSHPHIFLTRPSIDRITDACISPLP